MSSESLRRRNVDSSKSTSPPPLTPAKQRIVGHMNFDHKTSLFDYIEYYHNVKLNRSIDDVEMIDIELDKITLRYLKKNWAWNEVTIAIEPPMQSLSDSRVRLVSMAKQSANALGYSAYKVTKYIPIKFNSIDMLISFALPFFILLNVFPHIFLPIISKLNHSLGQLFINHRIKFLVIISLIHLVESSTLMRRRVIKYRVPQPQRTYWYISSFLEGFPVLFRFDEEVKRISN